MIFLKKIMLFLKAWAIVFLVSILTCLIPLFFFAIIDLNYTKAVFLDEKTTTTALWFDDFQKVFPSMELVWQEILLSTIYTAIVSLVIAPFIMRSWKKGNSYSAEYSGSFKNGTGSDDISSPSHPLNPLNPINPTSIMNPLNPASPFNNF